MTRRSDGAARADEDEGGTADWRAGWWRRATPIASPNFNARPGDARVDTIVLHSISLPPGEYGGDEIERLFTNTLDWSAHPYFETIRGLTVAAHFVVRRDGAVLQFVSIDDRAWHAGQSCWDGREGCNDFSIGIELEGLEGDPFEPAQYAALERLLPAIDTQRAIRHVIGHEHVAPGRKNDPGARFDWVGLASRLRWGGERIPFSKPRPD